VRLIDCKTLRPLELFGRVLGSGERLRLPEADALALIESGHVRAIYSIPDTASTGTAEQPTR